MTIIISMPRPFSAPPIQHSSALSFVQLLPVFFFFFALGSCARGPMSGLLVGDADGRRSSAGCVVDLRVRARRVPERDSTTTKGGAGNLHGLVSLFGQPRPTTIKVYGPRLPPCL